MTSWQEQLSASGIDEAIALCITTKGYTEADVWAAAFADDAAFEAWLGRLQVQVSGSFANMEPEDWLTSPHVGRLRLLWHKLRGHAAKPLAAVAAQAPETAAGLLGLATGAVLSSDQLATLWAQFDKNYPAEVLEADQKPCKQLILQIYQQKKKNELKFVPWKSLISEVQYDKSKQLGKSKETNLLGMLADVVGVSDTVEGEVTGSPYAVQRVLSLRAVCWALLDWCHLGSAKLVVNKFMLLYHRLGLASMGLRPPSVQEAEAADAELCRQLQDLLCKNYTQDQAIHEAVVVRDSLHMWLQPRVKLPRVPNGPYTRPDKKGNGKGKGKDGKGKGDTPKKRAFCYKYQIGKCGAGECRFEHACENCGEAGHGRSQCPQLTAH